MKCPLKGLSTMKKAVTQVILVIGLCLLTSSTAASAPGSIVNKSFNVAPGQFAVFPIAVHPRGGRVFGKFRSQDIECFIVDEDGLDNFENGFRFPVFYTSGRINVATIDVVLGEGRYFLVFNNRHAILRTKSVAASVFIELPNNVRQQDILDTGNLLENNILNCKSFRGSGIVRRRLMADPPPSRDVVFFELQDGDDRHNISFETPSSYFYNALRPGNKVSVIGRHCGTNYYADWVKRIR